MIGVTIPDSAYDNTEASSYASAPIAQVSHVVLLVFWGTAISLGTAPSMDVSGGGLTWTQSRDIPNGDVVYSSGVRRLGVAWASGSPSSGMLTFTGVNEGSGVTSTGLQYAVMAITGAHTSAPLVQVVNAGDPASATSVSVILSEAADTRNRVFAWESHRNNNPSTARTNWTSLSSHTGVGPASAALSQWRSNQFETTASSSWTDADRHSMIALEMRAASPDVISPALEIQRAIFLRLSTDPELPPVFDRYGIPETAPVDYVTVGPVAVETPDNTHSGFGTRTIAEISAWSDYAGTERMFEAGSRVTQLLDHKPMTLGGPLRLVEFRREQAQTVADELDPRRRRFRLTFAVITEQDREV